MAEFAIRPAEPQDVSTIVELIHELAEYEKLGHLCKANEASLQRQLFGEHTTLEGIVTEIRGELIGYALYFDNFSSFTCKPGIHVDDIYIKPSHRRLGFGTAMLERIVQVARERDCGRVEWVALNWNKPALSLYREIFHAELLKDWHVWRLTL